MQLTDKLIADQNRENKALRARLTRIIAAVRRIRRYLADHDLDSIDIGLNSILLIAEPPTADR